MYFQFLIREFIIIGEVILDIEYFYKEDYIDKLFLLAPVTIGIIVAVGCAVMSIKTQNLVLYPSVGVLVILSGILTSIFCLRKYLKTSKLTINTRELYFWANGSKYYFSDLMPTYEVKLSNSMSNLRWYDITLYFKNGAKESLFLSDKKASAFINKYLSVYSKPVEKELTGSAD